MGEGQGGCSLGLSGQGPPASLWEDSPLTV